MGEQLSSRTRHLKRALTLLGYKDAYRALELMIKEMSVEAGFARHNGKHYYYHLVDVAQLLLNFGIRDEATITAALLHDYVEDVEGVKHEDIAEQFGKEVADIVRAVSKEKGLDYKNNPVLMESYLENIFRNSKACLVKTADRVNNFQTLRDASVNHRRKQLENTMEYFIPFFKKCRNTYIEHESFYFQAKTTIEPLAYEIGRYLDDLAEYEGIIARQEVELAKLRKERGKRYESGLKTSGQTSK